MPKIALFLLLELGIVSAFRVVNGFWPPVGSSVGITAGGAYYLWRKQRK